MLKPSNKKIFLVTSALFTLILISAPGVLAKGFRGIIPLRSTKADVYKKWGPPDSNGGYQLEGVYAQVYYAEGQCIKDEIDCECLANKDTVVSISVNFQTEVKLDTLKLDLKRFERKVDSHLLVYESYSDWDAGVVYTVFIEDKTVTGAVYRGSKRDCEAIERGNRLLSN